MAVFERNYYWGDPFFTSMIMGGRGPIPQFPQVPIEGPIVESLTIIPGDVKEKCESSTWGDWCFFEVFFGDSSFETR